MKIIHLAAAALLLSVLPVQALAAKALLVDFVVSSNDSVTLNNLLLAEGKATRWAEGDYKVQLLNPSGSVLESQAIPVEFFVPGLGEVDAIPVEVRFSAYENAKKLQVLHSGKVIFESDIVLCDGNKKCDNYENVLSCPGDCASGSADKYCDRIKDGRCDPDCASEADGDCTAAQDYTLVAAGMAVLLAILAAAYFLARRRKREPPKESVPVPPIPSMPSAPPAPEAPSAPAMPPKPV